MLCGELGRWLDCRGGTSAQPEQCNGIDDDCDGQVDEGLEGCRSALVCPAFRLIEPMQELVVSRTEIDPSARSIRWTLICEAGATRCPVIADPTGDTLRLLFVETGTYRVRANVLRADTSESSCEFPVYVQGRGLRVELFWDTQGGIGSSGVDLDLHVAPIDRARSQPAQWFSQDDCHYANGRAPGGAVTWGLSPSDQRFLPSESPSLCRNAPPPWGQLWEQSGRCWNPRLDTDTTTCDRTVANASDPRFCFAESVAIDVMPDDVTFRVMVNFYRDHGTCSDATTTNDVSHPTLIVSCGAGIRTEIGTIDRGGLVSMSCRDNPAIGSANWSWLAADIRRVDNACGVRGCVVEPLLGRRLSLRRCAEVTERDDVCKDDDGRVFVRRAGGRPVDADLPEAL